MQCSVYKHTDRSIKLHTLSKLYYVPIGFVPLPKF